MNNDRQIKADKLLHAAECPLRRFIQYDGFLEKVFDAPEADDRFGLCPECGRTDGYLNVGRSHWFFCDEHKTRWCPGANLFSSWRDEPEAEWKANIEKLEGYREVESGSRPVGADDDIFSMVVDDLQQSGVPVRVQVLMGTKQEDAVRLLEKITDFLKRTSDMSWEAFRHQGEDKEADHDVPFEPTKKPGPGTAGAGLLRCFR